MNEDRNHLRRRFTRFPPSTPVLLTTTVVCATALSLQPAQATPAPAPPLKLLTQSQPVTSNNLSEATKAARAYVTAMRTASLTGNTRALKHGASTSCNQCARNARLLVRGHKSTKQATCSGKPNLGMPTTFVDAWSPEPGYVYIETDVDAYNTCVSTRIPTLKHSNATGNIEMVKKNNRWLVSSISSFGL